MKEAEAAQAELEEAHKQLRMKDIYLRQLGAYTGEHTRREDDARNLTGKLVYSPIRGNRFLERISCCFCELLKNDY